MSAPPPPKKKKKKKKKLPLIGDLDLFIYHTSSKWGSEDIEEYQISALKSV